MRKLQGGLEASLHRVGHPSFLVYFYTQAKPSYWSRTDRAQPVKPAAGGRSGELGSASAFPLQAPASRRRRGGNATGRGGREMAKSCKGLAMELVKCLSETDCVKVGQLLPPLSPRPPAPQLAAACFDPIGC